MVCIVPKVPRISALKKTIFKNLQKSRIYMYINYLHECNNADTMPTLVGYLTSFASITLYKLALCQRCFFHVYIHICDSMKMVV